MKKRGLFAAVLLCAAGTGAFGQAKTGLTDQFALFWDVRTGNAADDQSYTGIITRSALIGFQEKGFKPVPAGTVAGLIPDLDRTQPLAQTVIPKLSAAAKDQGSSFVVLISYIGDVSGGTFAMRAWDLSGKTFYDFQEKVRSGLELYNRLNDATAEVAARAGTVAKTSPEAAENPQEQKPKGYVQRIVVLSGDEGAEIWLNGVVRAGVIADGRLLPSSASTWARSSSSSSASPAFTTTARNSPWTRNRWSLPCVPSSAWSSTS